LVQGVEMRFEQRERYIVFHDDKPGSHATMFSPTGNKMLFDGNESSFRDDRREYAWAFVLETPLKDGDRIIFATADREIGGLVRTNGIEIVGVSSEVARAGDKPQELEDHNPRPRPIPLYRRDIYLIEWVDTAEGSMQVEVPVAVPEEVSLNLQDAYDRSGPWQYAGGAFIRCRRGIIVAKCVDDAKYIAEACEKYARLAAGIAKLKQLGHPEVDHALRNL
jgi:hypothetical protein